MSNSEFNDELFKFSLSTVESVTETVAMTGVDRNHEHDGLEQSQSSVISTSSGSSSSSIGPATKAEDDPFILRMAQKNSITSEAIDDKVEKAFRAWKVSKSKTLNKYQRLVENRELFESKTHQLFTVDIHSSLKTHIGEIKTLELREFMNKQIQDSYLEKVKALKEELQPESLKKDWISFGWLEVALPNSKPAADRIKQLSTLDLQGLVKNEFEVWQAQPKTNQHPKTPKRTRESNPRSESTRSDSRSNKRQRVCSTDVPTLTDCDDDSQHPEMIKKLFHVIGIPTIKIPPIIYDLLNKGIKFVPGQKTEMKDLELDNLVESIMKVVQRDHQHFPRCIVKDLLKRIPIDHLLKEHNLKYEFHPNILTDWLKSEKLTLRPADKNLGICVCTRDWYEGKLQELLNDETTYQRTTINEQELQNNIFNSYIELEKSMKLLQHKLKPFPPPPLKDSKLQEIYGLPKVHKSPISLRVIIPGFSLASTPVAKWLNSKLQRIKVHYSWVLTDFTTVVKDISQTQFNSQRLWLASFDVSNMYTNIKISELMQILQNILMRHAEDIGFHQEQIPLIMKVIKWILSNNYFLFNRTIFQQIQGIAMGQPLAPILADLFMIHFEIEWLKSLNSPTLYRRYLDDILILKEGFKENILKFYNELNTTTTSLTFTIEVNFHNIHFGDLTVFKGRRFQKHLILDTKLFIKPTAMNQQFTHPSSIAICMRNSSTNWITANQIRILRNSSNEVDYIDSMNHFTKQLEQSGYATSKILFLCRYSFEDREFFLQKRQAKQPPSQENPPTIKIPSCPITLKVLKLLLNQLRATTTGAIDYIIRINQGKTLVQHARQLNQS
jgi:Reverse transcriptase (RNA-dependent DNA polymerase)